jgi:hypothetical protein
MSKFSSSSTAARGVAGNYQDDCEFYLPVGIEHEADVNQTPKTGQAAVFGGQWAPRSAALAARAGRKATPDRQVRPANIGGAALPRRPDLRRASASRTLPFSSIIGFSPSTKPARFGGFVEAILPGKPDDSPIEKIALGDFLRQTFTNHLARERIDRHANK